MPSRTTAPATGLPGLRDLPVELNAGWTRPEDERILIVVERIEKNLNRVGVVEFRIAAILCDNDVLGLRIETDDADVEVAVVKADADLGTFR